MSARRHVFTRLDGTKVRGLTLEEKGRREKLQAAAAKRAGLVPFDGRRGTAWLEPGEADRRKKLQRVAKQRVAFDAVERGTKSGQFISPATRDTGTRGGAPPVLRWTLIDGRRVEDSTAWGHLAADAIDAARDRGATKDNAHRYNIEWRATYSQYGEARIVATPSPLPYTETYGPDAWMSVIWWRLRRQMQGPAPVKSQERRKPARRAETAGGPPQKSSYPPAGARGGGPAISLSPPAPPPDGIPLPPETLQDLRVWIWLAFIPPKKA